MTAGNVRLSRAWDDIAPYYISGQGPSVAGTAQYGTTGFFWYKLADNHAKNEELQFSFQIPHRWAAGTNVHFHLHTVPSANGAAGNEDVVIRTQYQWVNIGGAYGTATSDNTTVDTIFRVGAAEANTHALWETTDSWNGSTKTLSSDLVVIISRLSNSSSDDNYTGDVWLRYVDLHVEIDSLGSLSEVVK